MSSHNFNFGDLLDVVKNQASQYEAALESLSNSAEASESTGTTPGSVSITDATLATTQVQVTQSLTEMASGIAKNAADHVKKIGKSISS